MSRQYLKQLQDRAQRLLEASSEQDDEDEINAYTATQRGVKSPRRIDLDDFLHEDPKSEEEEISQFRYETTTDVELLKKCISLTNQNNNLKYLLEKQSKEIESLNMQLKAKSDLELQLKYRIKEYQDPAKKTKLVNIEAAIDKIQRQKKEIQLQRYSLDKQRQQFENETKCLKQQFQKLEQLRLSIQYKENKKEIDIHNDYTVKNNRFIDNERIKCKLAESQEKIKRLEQLVRDERVKCAKLYKFINKQIPALNNIIVELTAKLNARFEKLVLRNIEL